MPSEIDRGLSHDRSGVGGGVGVGRGRVGVGVGVDGLEDSFEPYEVYEESWASHGVFRLVGNGERTNPSCGVFRVYKVCLRTDLHSLMRLDGKDYSGKVYGRRVRHTCHRADCPICFKSGFCVREAKNIEGRIVEACKRFQGLEHFSVSWSSSESGLTVAEMRRKVQDACVARGILGGVMLFHGFRYHGRDEARRLNVPFGWVWGVHFHVLGFLKGGYRCRGCTRYCPAHPECGGFEAVTRKVRERDGCIVKVAEDKFGRKLERKSVYGTAYYQLTHATLDSSVKRFHIATWFGTCSYRKLKVSVDVKKKRDDDVCPICRHELVSARYFGCLKFVMDKHGCFLADFEEDGRVVWVEIEDEHERSQGRDVGSVIVWHPRDW